MAVFAFGASRFAVAEIQAAPPDDLLTDAFRSPFICFKISIFTEEFRSEISKQRVGFLLSVTVLKITEVLRGVDGQCPRGTRRGLKYLVVVEGEILGFIRPQKHGTGLVARDVLPSFNHPLEAEFDDCGGNLPHQAETLYILIDDQDSAFAVKAFE